MAAKLEGQSRPLRLAVGADLLTRSSLKQWYLRLSVWRPIVAVVIAAVVVYCLFIAVCCYIVLMITSQ